jgi:phospholipid/cholesterol/gamma-HCH transport system substrate-binding protein
MNEQARYALIGAFVLIVLITSIWFVLWMGEGFNRGTTKYWVNFDESVVGLLPKAPVTFNGVTVGEVDTMNIAPHNAKKVRVLLTIDADTPINQSTRAQLDSMGLTGVAFVDLSAVSATAPPLKPLPGDSYPTIPSELSFLGKITGHATTLSANLIEVTNNINNLLNQHNQNAIEHTLQNISSLSAKLPDSLNHLNKTLKTLDQAGNSVNAAGDSFKHTSQSIRQTAVASQRLMTQVNQQTLPQASQMMKQLSQVSTRLQSLLQTLKQHPAMLVRGKAPAALGPGES